MIEAFLQEELAAQAQELDMRTMFVPEFVSTCYPDR